MSHASLEMLTDAAAEKGQSWSRLASSGGHSSILQIHLPRSRCIHYWLLLRCYQTHLYLLRPWIELAGGYAAVQSVQYSAVQCSSRVGVFNCISATIGCVVWSWQCLCFWCTCRSFTQTAHCEGHGDYSSCKAVLETIKFKEKPSCVN